MSARISFLVPAVCAAAALIGLLLPQQAAAQQLRLEDQRVEGVKRVCVYRSLTQQAERRVGRGEPCPSRFRPPAVTRPAIPSFATLQRRGYEAGRPVCVYAYQQREYRQAASASGFCPYTPVAHAR